MAEEEEIDFQQEEDVTPYNHFTEAARLCRFPIHGSPHWERAPLSESPSSPLNPTALSLIGRLCKTDSDLTTLGSLLNLISAQPFQAELRAFKATSATAFTKLEVWPDTFFFFRRLDTVIKEEFFADPLVFERLTLSCPGSRFKKISAKILDMDPLSFPFGIIFWSDSTRLSNWGSISLHPIMMKCINDPEGKFTLIGLLPTKIVTERESHESYVKKYVLLKCWEMLLSTAPLGPTSHMIAAATSDGNRIDVKPFVMAFTGDLPELDGIFGLIANNTCCRTCLLTGDQLSPSYALLHSLPLRNQAAEHLLKSSAMTILTESFLWDSHPLVLRLAEMNLHTLPSPFGDLIGGIPPGVDDVDHHFEAGVGQNIFENISTLIEGVSNVSFNNFVTNALHVLSEKRCTYPGQHRMNIDFHFAKKFGNFNARRTLLTNLPFIIAPLVGRDHLALLLSITYVAFRSFLDCATSDSDLTEYEDWRIAFCSLYNILICPLLAQSAHPKIHRIAAHMGAADLARFGSFSQFRTKHGESTLKQWKKLWNSQQGMSSAMFHSSVCKAFNRQLLSGSKPLHVSENSQTFVSDKEIYYDQFPSSQLRKSSLAMLPESVLSSIDRGACRVKPALKPLSPVSRDSFVKANGNRGIILEILRINKTWKLLVLCYRFIGNDELFFDFPVYQRTPQLKLLPISSLTKKYSMIPKFVAERNGRSINLAPVPTVPESLFVRKENRIHSNGALKMIKEHPRTREFFASVALGSSATDSCAPQMRS